MRTDELFRRGSGFSVAIAIVALVCLYGGYSPGGLEAKNEGEGRIDHPDLRYRILDQFKDAFFCDPDRFPVGLSPAVARKRALEKFPQIEKDHEAVTAILQHLGVESERELTEEQKVRVYKEYNKLRGAVALEELSSGIRFTIGLKEKTGDVLVHGTVAKNGTISFTERSKTFLDCPICLSEDTEVDTPKGPVLVTQLKKGEVVWSLDLNCIRTAVPVLAVVAQIAPPGHRVLELSLQDGRQLVASPGHPTSDTRIIGQLRVGDIYDHSVVEGVKVVEYDGQKTYDLLPAGPTGYYWANGVLVGSSLFSTPVVGIRKPCSQRLCCAISSRGSNAMTDR